MVEDDRAKSSGRADAAVAGAESLLRTGAEQVLAARDAGQIRRHVPKDRTQADAVRARILETLATLDE